MDPYLEHPLLWPDFHHRLVVMLAHQLQARLRPRYVASIEARVFRERLPPRFGPNLVVREGGLGQKDTAACGLKAADVPIILELEEVQVHEPRVEILDLTDHEKVVAALEVVSPSNKRVGLGRRSYGRKQREVLADKIHLIEIDLLRSGRHVLHIPRWCVQEQKPYDYLVCVNRWPRRNRFELYARRLRERLPRVAIPLTDPDPDVPLDLQAALAEVYEHASYPLLVRYDDPCDPPLDAADQQWADERWAAYRAAHPELFPPAAP